MQVLRMSEACPALQVEKMKEIAKLKAKEEKKKLESEVTFLYKRLVNYY